MCKFGAGWSLVPQTQTRGFTAADIKPFSIDEKTKLSVVFGSLRPGFFTLLHISRSVGK
jgi:hypothetical protein